MNQGKINHETILHGTAVAVMEGEGVPEAIFLRGFSGTGKSDLAFRLIGRGALLVSDDQVRFVRRQDRLFAEGVASIQGMIEVRGVGLARVETALSARLVLVVDLVARDDVPRLPPEREIVDILGIAVPRLRLHAFDASTPDKINLMLRALHDPKILAT